MQDKIHNEKIFDALLKVAVDEALKREMESLPSVEELDKIYKPSAAMDKRIKDLIKKDVRKRKRSGIIKRAGKAAASIAIIITVLSTVLLSVKATRNAIFNAFINWKEKSAEIKFDDPDKNENGIYKPTYIPEGFSEESTSKFGDTYTIIYKNDNGDSILFDQLPADGGDIKVDNENSKYDIFSISGKTAYLFEATSADDRSVLIWEENDTAFQITGSISKDELIHICESIE